MANQTRQTLERMMTPEIREQVATIHECWRDITFQNVVDATAATETVEPTDTTARAYIVGPDNTTDIDESRSIVIVLPHLNGWKPQHYIRAKVTQQLVAPNSNVIVLPNNCLGQENYNFKKMSTEDQDALARGNMKPYGEMQVRTLDRVCDAYRLGKLGVTGYGFGGLAALAITAHNNNLLNITHVNADEIPSKQDRSVSAARADYIMSRAINAQKKCITDTNIPALNEALNTRRLKTDLARFLLKTQSHDGVIVEAAMRGSAHYEVRLASDSFCFVKIGYVEDSKMFEPASLGKDWLNKALTSLVLYGGSSFRGHPSGENLINYALMARQGLNR